MREGASRLPPLIMHKEGIMEIYGKEVNFFLSVWAIDQISKLDNKDSFTKNAATMAILSQAYEDRREAEEKGYKANPITFKQILSLKRSEFNALIPEMEKAIEEGLERTVEAEEDKKKEGEASS